MKKAKEIDELRPEYKLSDFMTRGVRGKYYKRIIAEGTNVVLLDRDVAKAFPDSITVNEALRSILKTRHSRRPTAPRVARRRAAT
ncbi:MAG: hypothetical protein ACREVG_17345 [Burkholderiales bacterium]